MLKGVFIQGRQGRLFCTIRLPAERPRYAVMVVPAFGDEMNKTRRMLSVLAQRLNKSSIAVLIPDLFGTGDSEGSFLDADWRAWIDDLLTVQTWAKREHLEIRGLVAVRTGALMASEMSRSLAEDELRTTVFWQPVRSGATFVKQLLRVRTVAGAVGSGPREAVTDLIAQISAGETVLVGGYPLTRATVLPLMSLNLGQIDGTRLGTLHCVEVTRSQEGCGEFLDELGPSSMKGMRYMGEPYWSSTETVCDLNVVTRTSELFAGSAVHLG